MANVVKDLKDLGDLLVSGAKTDLSPKNEPIAKLVNGTDSAENNLIAEGIKKVKAAKAAKTKKTPTTSAETQAEEGQIADQNDFNTLAQGLVTQDQQLQVPVGQAIGGELTGPATSSAESQALAAIGLSPTSSASSWLNSEIAQGNANDSPMTQALNAYQQAYSAGQGVIDQAITNVGEGNQLGVATAAEQPFLNQLSSHLGSEQYYTIPSDVASQLSPALQTALANAGFLGVTAPKAPASATLGLAPAASSASSILGSLPTTGGLAASGAVNTPSTQGNASITSPESPTASP
jgi:hypothetical protein